MLVTQCSAINHDRCGWIHHQIILVGKASGQRRRADSYCNAMRCQLGAIRSAPSIQVFSPLIYPCSARKTARSAYSAGRQASGMERVPPVPAGSRRIPAEHRCTRARGAGHRSPRATDLGATGDASKYVSLTIVETSVRRIGERTTIAADDVTVEVARVVSVSGILAGRRLRDSWLCCVLRSLSIRPCPQRRRPPGPHLPLAGRRHPRRLSCWRSSSPVRSRWRGSPRRPRWLRARPRTRTTSRASPGAWTYFLIETRNIDDVRPTSRSSCDIASSSETEETRSNICCSGRHGRRSIARPR